MSHALRKLEKNDTGTWYRMPMSHYYFSRKERAALKRGKIVDKWGARFRLHAPKHNA